jgi:hypothetical protein
VKGRKGGKGGPKPLTTYFCRDCDYHCFSPQRLAEHEAHDLQPAGPLYRVHMPSIDARRPVGLWVRDDFTFLIRHDTALDDGYELGELLNGVIYSPPQKNEILKWVDELKLPV